MRPPPAPPPGPRSTTQSACLATSMLCSITRTVLPLSTSAWRRAAGGARPRSGARRGLVQDVERAARAGPRELLGQLDPLRLAARDRRRLLAEADVAQPDGVERAELARDAGLVLEERERLGDRHLQHLGDVLALERDRQRLGVVALALARLALDVDVRQEVHLQLHDARALARLAPPALDVEREPPRLVAADLGLGQAREQVADEPEQARCRSPGSTAASARSATGRWRSPCRRAPAPSVSRRGAGRSGRCGSAAPGSGQRLVDERRLAAAGHARHDGQRAERDLEVDVVEVVAARARAA